MNRRALLSMMAATILAAGPARADQSVDRILRDLKQLGYGRISVERTLLRRTRIVASNAEAQREIIVNTATGEILRDLWIPLDRTDSGGDGLLGSPQQDDDDDDDDDGDGDGDNSGSGSGDDGGGDDGGGQGRGRGRGGDDD